MLERRPFEKGTKFYVGKLLLNAKAEARPVQPRVQEWDDAELKSAIEKTAQAKQDEEASFLWLQAATGCRAACLYPLWADQVDLSPDAVYVDWWHRKATRTATSALRYPYV
jgi:hypothetical protein